MRAGPCKLTMLTKKNLLRGMPDFKQDCLCATAGTIPCCTPDGKLGTTDLMVAISVGGDFACEAMNAALRLDTPSARAFLDQFVELP